MRIDTHFLGGGRHFGSWEIADIGFIVLYRRGGKLVRSKVALLQSKRLYPIEQDFEEDKPLDYMRGFGRLLEDDEDFRRVIKARSFSFNQKCCYKALVVGDSQYQAISKYEAKYSIPVHYMLYNPPKLGYRVTLPKRWAAARTGTRRVTVTSRTFYHLLLIARNARRAGA